MEKRFYFNAKYMKSTNTGNGVNVIVKTTKKVQSYGGIDAFGGFSSWTRY